MSPKPRSNPVVNRNWKKVYKGNGASSGVWLDRSVRESQTLYRYVRWNPFGRQMFEDRNLFFSAPYRWSDPYEKWWCEQLFRDGSKLATVNAYGWCSTTAWGHEPYWRMYDDGGKTPVIRVTTSVRRLINVLSTYVDVRSAKAYIGKVMYHDPVELKKESRRLRELGQSAQVSRNVAHALMLKRNAFRFESEHRIAIIEHGDQKKHRLLDFDPPDLFTQVMLGPSVSKQDELGIRYLLRKYGFGDDKVQRSTLYDPVRNINQSRALMT